MDMKMFRDNLWGEYGFPSWSDGSVSQEVKLAVLNKMGYVDNEAVRFNSWTELTAVEGEQNCIDIAPYSVLLTYVPSYINWVDCLKVELYTEWQDDKAGCVIPTIESVVGRTRIAYPLEKNEEGWLLFYQEATALLKQIEEILFNNEWFYSKDNFAKFQNSKDERCWLFNDKKVDFERIQFGGRGDYWGTLWYLKECDR
jgi:hypothetical protein